ncbi:hypothetical protein [Desulfobacula sp.]|uniref:hypothetical protein n=1 Tax=Desulfobacula sp. TaxID=2593537 RepID=UPI001EC16166|nr:hypothetical protein [Desulfobacula sp.]
MEIPVTEKKIKQRISSYRSALKKEIETYGIISDGYGKRYLLFSLYFVLNDLEKSAEYFEWFEEEFPADVGEPGMYLSWAVSLHRMGKDRDARIKLAMLLLSNIYFIPQLLGDIDIKKEDMWHSSNYEEIDYFDYMPDDIFKEISSSEKEWIKTVYQSDDFQKMKKTHIDIYGELLHEKNVEKRKALVDMSSVQWLHLYGMPIDVVKND